LGVDHLEKKSRYEKSNSSVNCPAENLVELLKVPKEEGEQIVGEIEEYPYGKFDCIMDLTEII